MIVVFNYYLVLFCSGSIGSSDTEPNSKKDQLVLDICVICLEQEYNAVFVP
jgi:E3 ubiquitin-protein ligase MUL1